MADYSTMLRRFGEVGRRVTLLTQPISKTPVANLAEVDRSSRCAGRQRRSVKTQRVPTHQPRSTAWRTQPLSSAVMTSSCFEVAVACRRCSAAPNDMRRQ